MNLLNTPSRNKIIPFAGSLIEVPVKSNFLIINLTGHVYASETDPREISDVVFIPMDARLVAVVEGHDGVTVIDISDMVISYVEKKS